MSDSFWIVEVKLGDVWAFMPSVYMSRQDAREACKWKRQFHIYGEYRVRKYQRVEP